MASLSRWRTIPEVTPDDIEDYQHQGLWVWPPDPVPTAESQADDLWQDAIGDLPDRDEDQMAAEQPLDTNEPFSIPFSALADFEPVELDSEPPFEGFVEAEDTPDSKEDHHSLRGDRQVRSYGSFVGVSLAGAVKQPAPIDIGVDVDGCLYPLAEVMQAWTASSTGTSLPAPVTSRAWHKDWGMEPAEFDSVIAAAIAAGVAFESGVPDTDLLATLRRLADSGHRIHVITSERSNDGASREATRAWLWRWGVPHESLHVVQGSKAEALSAMGVRIMVEDSLPHALELQHHCRLLVWAKPWNATWQGERITDGWQLETAVQEEAQRMGTVTGGWC